MQLGWQVIGLVLLVLGVWAGEGWLQRRLSLTGSERQARTLAIMTGVGGLVGAIAWWQNLPYAFSWALPPLAARMLAVAGVAFGAVALRAAWIGTVGHLRLIAAMLVVYLGPLAVAAIALHLDRFNFLEPITYVFFGIVVLMLIAALSALINLPFDERGLSSGLLGLVGTVAGLWGLALFVWPTGPWPLIWPWPQDALTTRLIASMFLTVSTACFMAEGPAERRSVHILCLLYGAGIDLACALALSAGKPVSLAYMIFWALVAAEALVALITERGALPIPGSSHRG